MKKQIELEAIKQQLEYTLEEVHKKRSDKNLMHDWLTDALSRVKKLTIPAVSNSLPVDYLQTEMIKAIKELAKESTAPDKVTPDWMENDIKRGMQWMHKRLTGNDC